MKLNSNFISYALLVAGVALVVIVILEGISR